MIPQISKIIYATDLTKNVTYAFYFEWIWRGSITPGGL